MMLAFLTSLLKVFDVKHGEQTLCEFASTCVHGGLHFSISSYRTFKVPPPSQATAFFLDLFTINESNVGIGDFYII